MCCRPFYVNSRISRRVLCQNRERKPDLTRWENTRCLCAAHVSTRHRCVWRVRVTVRERTRGYKVLRLLYGGRGMWVRKPALLTSDSIRVSRGDTHRQLSSRRISAFCQIRPHDSIRRVIARASRRRPASNASPASACGQVECALRKEDILENLFAG